MVSRGGQGTRRSISFCPVSEAFCLAICYSIISGEETGRLQRNQDAVIAVTRWTLAIMICASFLLLSGNYTFTQAVFEQPAWSTTGLSVADVGRAYLSPVSMHRSTILFSDKIGLVLVMLSVLSDTYGMRLGG